jgi:hypothetical protein
VRASFLAVPFVLIASLPASLPAFAQSSHDGRWRAEVETTVGNCQRSAQIIVTVKDNKVSEIDAAGVTAWGYIDETNTFVGRFTAGEKIARANGDVKGNTASGPWSSNTDYCGGRWTARKID